MKRLFGLVFCLFVCLFFAFLLLLFLTPAAKKKMNPGAALQWDHLLRMP